MPDLMVIVSVGIGLGILSQISYSLHQIRDELRKLGGQKSEGKPELTTYETIRWGKR